MEKIQEILRKMLKYLPFREESEALELHADIAALTDDVTQSEESASVEPGVKNADGSPRTPETLG